MRITALERKSRSKSKLKPEMILRLFEKYTVSSDLIWNEISVCQNTDCLFSLLRSFRLRRGALITFYSANTPNLAKKQKILKNKKMKKILPFNHTCWVQLIPFLSFESYICPRCDWEGWPLCKSKTIKFSAQLHAKWKNPIKGWVYPKSIQQLNNNNERILAQNFCLKVLHVCFSQNGHKC